MISERSCDTQDWSNDTENSALHHRNKLHFKMYYNKKYILICNNVSKYSCIFDQINAALLSKRDFFQKHLRKSYPLQTLDSSHLESIDLLQLLWFLITKMILTGWARDARTSRLYWTNRTAGTTSHHFTYSNYLGDLSRHIIFWQDVKYDLFIN